MTEKDLSNTCIICGKVRTYKTLQGLKSANKNKSPCRSCTNSIVKGGTGKIFNKDGLKLCFDCKIYKELIEFHFIPVKNSYHSICKLCGIKRSNKYHKEFYRFGKYEITKEYYDNLLLKQKGKCDICEEKMIKPHIDHDHKTGKVRGLLCDTCNKGLGQFMDNKNTIYNAFKYLTKYE